MSTPNDDGAPTDNAVPGAVRSDKFVGGDDEALASLRLMGIEIDTEEVDAPDFEIKATGKDYRSSN